MCAYMYMYSPGGQGQGATTWKVYPGPLDEVAEPWRLPAQGKEHRDQNMKGLASSFSSVNCL